MNRISQLFAEIARWRDRRIKARKKQRVIWAFRMFHSGVGGISEKKREEQKHNIPTKSSTKSRKESCQIQTTWPVMFINFEMFIGISCKLDDFSRRFRWGLPLRPEADENGWFNLAMIWPSFHRQTGGYASRVSAEARKNVAPNGGYATLATPASSWPLRFIDQNIYFNSIISLTNISWYINNTM